MHEILIANLQQLLHRDIQHIHQSDGSDVALAAGRRLEAVAEHAPSFICLLAEPWLCSEIGEQQRMLLSECARIHLYARVLDDAIDEAALIHRQNLLRAQPMFWQAVQRIGSLVPTAVANEAVVLIAEAVAAVQIDDRQRNPNFWGPKNHHLLLIPLLLSCDSPKYRKCRSGLSTLIALVQAGDEWRQGEFYSASMHAKFFQFLTDCLGVEQLELLSQSGWKGVVERIIWNSHQLLDGL